MVARERIYFHAGSALFWTLLRFIAVCYNHCLSRVSTHRETIPHLTLFISKRNGNPTFCLPFWVSFSKCVLSTYYVSGIVTATGIKINKTWALPEMLREARRLGTVWNTVTHGTWGWGRGVRKRAGGRAGGLCWFKFSQVQVTETQLTVAQAKGGFGEGKWKNSWTPRSGRQQSLRKEGENKSRTGKSGGPFTLFSRMSFIWKLLNSSAEWEVSDVVHTLKTDLSMRPPSAGPPSTPSWHSGLGRSIHIVLSDHLTVSKLSRFLDCLECWQMDAQEFLSLENQMQAE